MSKSVGRTLMLEGRIVWASGDLFKGQHKTDQNTRQPLFDAQGNPKIQYGFGLAVAKEKVAEMWNAMHEEAYTLYPSRQLPPLFSMKYKDGDGVDHNGKPFSEREGYANHLVFALTTSLPIKYFKHDYTTKQNIMVNEGIKCGDYVTVQVSIKAHPAIGQGRPGLYLNPMAVLHTGYGKEIVNAPSGDQIFGAVAPQVPAGASATPLSPVSGLLVPMPQATPAMPVMPVMPQSAPAMPVMPVMPQAAPAPHYGVIPQVHQPQAAPAMPTMPGFPPLPKV